MAEASPNAMDREAIKYVIFVAIGVIPIVAGIILLVLKGELFEKLLGNLGVEDELMIVGTKITVRVIGVLAIVVGLVLTAYLVVLPLLENLEPTAETSLAL